MGEKSEEKTYARFRLSRKDGQTGASFLLLLVQLFVCQSTSSYIQSCKKRIYLITYNLETWTQVPGS